MLEERVAKLEKQIAAMQLVLRELARYAEAVGEDVDDLMGEGEEG